MRQLSKFFELLETFRYLTCVGNFLAVLHKNLFSNNFSQKESFWMLTSNPLIINKRESIDIESDNYGETSGDFLCDNEEDWKAIGQKETKITLMIKHSPSLNPFHGVQIKTISPSL